MTNDVTGWGKNGFGDPARDWKRSGVLSGVGCLTWITVLLCGVAWHYFAAPLAKHDPATDAVSARTAARIMFYAIYTQEDADKANAELCWGYRGPDPADLIAELEGQNYDHDISIDGSTSMTVTIRLYGNSPFQYRHYQVEGYDSGTSSCIAEVDYE